MQGQTTPNKKQKLRRSSINSNKSFHSIDQFRLSSPFESYGRTNKFPFRPTVNIVFILLTTIQVYLLINSRIYLRGELVRTFLSVYIDQEKYPNLFDGKQFYLQITNVQQLQQHFNYMFKRVNIIENDSFVDFDYSHAKFILHTQYKEFAGSDKNRQVIHPINPKIGIVKPFNMSNITDIQLYLLQIQQFQIQIQNLTMKQNWQGFSEKYTHQITYKFLDNIKIQINFNFKISNAMINNVQLTPNSRSPKSWIDQNQHVSMANCIKSNCYYRRNIKTLPGFASKGNTDLADRDETKLKEVPYPTTYIIKIRIFYAIVFLVSLVSLYLNFIQIRRTYKILTQQLSKSQINQMHDKQQTKSNLSHQLISQQEQDQIKEQVRKWVQTNYITVTEMKLSHYFHILEFDLIFSTLSNIFQIIAAFYLVSGIEQQRIAGIACLFSWLTIFKFIRNYKQLVLMYQLIKLSIAKVTKFFVQFLPVFLSYALLGLCLFPKVSFFSSLANSVTTLVCLMMGDSIQMITDAMIDKNAILLVILYIFSFVLLFMHAIHNTLTSLIKQFFIIKKIQLVQWQKQQAGDQQYLYIQEVKTNSDKQKSKLPLKLTTDLMKSLLRVKALQRTQQYERICRFLCAELDAIRMKQKWMIRQNQMSKIVKVKQELIRRSMALSSIIRAYDVQSTRRKKSGANLLRRTSSNANNLQEGSSKQNKQSLITQTMQDK